MDALPITYQQCLSTHLRNPRIFRKDALPAQLPQHLLNEHRSHVPSSEESLDSQALDMDEACSR